MALKDLIPWRRKESLSLFDEEHPIAALRRQMDRLFEDFFRGFEIEPFWGFESRLGRFSPRVNVTETDDEIRVTAELPGLDEKDIEVTLDRDMLTIKGEKKQEHEEKKGNYYRMERTFGSFQRTIPLPAEVQEDKAEASFEKGVLTITLPKTEEAKSQKKRIEVKTS